MKFDRTRTLYCLSAKCRCLRQWVLILKTAPVYACSVCAVTREITPTLPVRYPVAPSKISGRAASSILSALAGSRANYAARSERVARAPSCGCCGAFCRQSDGRLTRRCACDPNAPRCHACSRGVCHCRCPKTLAARAGAMPGPTIDCTENI